MQCGYILHTNKRNATVHLKQLCSQPTISVLNDRLSRFHDNARNAASSLYIEEYETHSNESGALHPQNISLQHTTQHQNHR